MENDSGDSRLDRFFAAARKVMAFAPEEEYGFESRVMERIRRNREERMPLLVWSWRLIPVFVSLVIFMGIWTYASEPRLMVDLSAMTRISGEEATLMASLAGE